METPVIGSEPNEQSTVVKARPFFGSHADDARHQVPVYGEPVPKPLACIDRPVPYDCFLVRSTSNLWDWWRETQRAQSGDDSAGNISPAADITKLIAEEEDRVKKAVEDAHRAQSSETQYREALGRIASAFEAVLVWPQKKTQCTAATLEGYLEWARLWIALGLTLRECDPQMEGCIGKCLRNLATVPVPPLHAAASLLQLSQEGSVEDAARSLAELDASPTMRHFIAFLPWICNGLTDTIPSSALLPRWMSNEDMQEAMRAWGCNIIGPANRNRPTVKLQEARPESAEKLLQCVEFQRKSFLERATKDGSQASGVRVDTPSEFAAFLRGELHGDVILPRIEPLWVDAARLGVNGLPRFPGEPETVVAAIEAYDMLASCLRSAIKQPPGGHEELGSVQQTDENKNQNDRTHLNEPIVTLPETFIDSLSGRVMRPLLKALNGKVRVLIDDILQLLYRSKSRTNLDALLQVVLRLNKLLAESDRRCQVSKEGETLRLAPL
jgi:hypothetical protein